MKAETNLNRLLIICITFLCIKKLLVARLDFQSTVREKKSTNEGKPIKRWKSTVKFLYQTHKLFNRQSKFSVINFIKCLINWYIKYFFFLKIKSFSLNYLGC